MGGATEHQEIRSGGTVQQHSFGASLRKLGPQRNSRF
jgi:hypothetical protein